MSEAGGYAVFLFPAAIEALGEAITPFLVDSPMGPHIPCRDLDAGGALMQLGVLTQGHDGHQQRMTLMLPSSMVRLVLSRTASPSFGFGPRTQVVQPPAVATPRIEAEAGDAAEADAKADDKAGEKADEPDDAGTDAKADAVGDASGDTASDKPDAAPETAPDAPETTKSDTDSDNAAKPDSTG